MMGYDYKLVYKKGTSNVVAGVLSRQLMMQLHAISIISSDLFQRIHHSWVTDANLVHLLHSIQKHPEKHSKYTWQNNQLSRNEKLLVGQDQQLRDDLLNFFHNFGE